MHHATRLFLSQSQAENKAIFQNAIHDNFSVFWDNVAVTAATNAQAEMYQSFIDDRVDREYLPSQCRYYVEPDKGEARIGSGGATLCMLAELLLSCGGDIDKLIAQKSLLLHSGGESKRLPHSAPFGKLFTLSGAHIDGDLRNSPGTVFDDVMVSLAGLPSRMRGGVVVVSADAFFRFNHTQLDLDTPDAAALAMKAPVSEGMIHGVFVEKDNSGYVSRFLHKMPEEELRRVGAVTDTGKVDLDIGITYLGENAIKALLSLVLDDFGAVDDKKLSVYANEKVRLSFYGDIIYPMAADSDAEAFLEQAAEGDLTPELRDLRPGIFEALHHVPLKIIRLIPGMIRNMGTTDETLETLRFFKEEARLNGGTYDADIALNSRISRNAVVGAGSFIENSRIHDGARIGENCLISGCDIFSGFEAPDNTALHCVRLNSGKWVCRAWDISDDIKSSRSWFGNTLAEWDSGADSLWNAKLFPVCGKQKDALEWARMLISGEMTAEDTLKWQTCERIALSDTVEMDIAGMLADRAVHEDNVRIDAFAEKVLGGTPVDEVLRYLGVGENAARRLEQINSRLADGFYTQWQDEMRLYMCIGEAAGMLGLKLSSYDLKQKGLEVLRKAAAKPRLLSHYEAREWTCDSVEVALPIRVNMGGTWSDAPPYCYEHGGTMLNAAACLDGKLPILVCAERLEEPVIELKSADLQRNERYEVIDPLLNYNSPEDPFILFKAALAMADLIAPGRCSLKERLTKMGGGVRITSNVSVTGGSGLGTSSILTGAMVKALTKLCGQDRSAEELSDDVLIAEQLMTTGGGWQDVIGGMYPGIKLTFTKPGIPQEYDVQTLMLSKATEAELNYRGFLMYTGQRRLARSVLRRVVSNYVCNNRESLAAFDETRRLAVIMAHELRRGNVNIFGNLLSEHMRLLKQLDASSSNIMLDHIMDGLKELTDGTTLCGAAGGGFLYGISKPNVTHDDIRAWIEQEYGGTAIRLYTSEISK